VNVDATNTEVATHLDRIGQVAISVSDLARSKDFYQNKLGMKFLFDAGSMAFFQCGDIRILIGASDKPIETSSTILYFKVGDIHAVHTHLAGKGVTFTDPPHLVAKMPDHDLWIAFLRDPDDHPIGLMAEIPRVA